MGGAQNVVMIALVCICLLDLEGKDMLDDRNEMKRISGGKGPKALTISFQ